MNGYWQDLLVCDGEGAAAAAAAVEAVGDDADVGADAVADAEVVVVVAAAGDYCWARYPSLLDHYYPSHLSVKEHAIHSR